MFSKITVLSFDHHQELGLARMLRNPPSPSDKTEARGAAHAARVLGGGGGGVRARAPASLEGDAPGLLQPPQPRADMPSSPRSGKRGTGPGRRTRGGARKLPIKINTIFMQYVKNTAHTTVQGEQNIRSLNK